MTTRKKKAATSPFPPRIYVWRDAEGECLVVENDLRGIDEGTCCAIYKRTNVGHIETETPRYVEDKKP